MAQHSPFPSNNPFSDPRVNPYAAAQTPFGTPQARGGGSNGLAIAGLILTICGLVAFWVPVVGFGLSLTGFILAGFGLRRAKTKHAGVGKKMSIAALLVGTVATLVGGAWTGGTVAYGVYSADAAHDFARIHVAIDSFKAREGRVPTSLAELDNPGLIKDYFGNTYGYSVDEAGNFNIDAEAFGACNQVFEAMQFKYDSAAKAIRLKSGQFLLDPEAFRIIAKEMVGPHAIFDSKSNSDACPAACPAKDSAPVAPAAPKSPERVGEDA